MSKTIEDKIQLLSILISLENEFILSSSSSQKDSQTVVHFVHSLIDQSRKWIKTLTSFTSYSEQEVIERIQASLKQKITNAFDTNVDARIQTFVDDHFYPLLTLPSSQSCSEPEEKKEEIVQITKKENLKQKNTGSETEFLPRHEKKRKIDLYLSSSQSSTYTPLRNLIEQALLLPCDVTPNQILKGYHLTLDLDDVETLKKSYVKKWVNKVSLLNQVINEDPLYLVVTHSAFIDNGQVIPLLIFQFQSNVFACSQDVLLWVMEFFEIYKAQFKSHPKSFHQKVLSIVENLYYMQEYDHKNDSCSPSSSSSLTRSPKKEKYWYQIPVIETRLQKHCVISGSPVILPSALPKNCFNWLQRLYVSSPPSWKLPQIMDVIDYFPVIHQDALNRLSIKTSPNVDPSLITTQEGTKWKVCSIDYLFENDRESARAPFMRLHLECSSLSYSSEKIFKTLDVFYRPDMDAYWRVSDGHCLSCDVNCTLFQLIQDLILRYRPFLYVQKEQDHVKRLQEKHPEHQAKFRRFNQMVPYQSSLKFITHKIQTGYYRSLASFIDDVYQIYIASLISYGINDNYTKDAENLCREFVNKMNHSFEHIALDWTIQKTCLQAKFGHL